VCLARDVPAGLFLAVVQRHPLLVGNNTIGLGLVFQLGIACLPCLQRISFLLCQTARGDKFVAFVKSELARYQPVVKASGATVD